MPDARLERTREAYREVSKRPMLSCPVTVFDDMRTSLLMNVTAHQHLFVVDPLNKRWVCACGLAWSNAS